MTSKSEICLMANNIVAIIHQQKLCLIYQLDLKSSALSPEHGYLVNISGMKEKKYLNVFRSKCRHI